MFMFFSIKYRYSDILLKKHKLHLSRLFCWNHTCYCVNLVSVTSASRYIAPASCYHPRYQSRFSMYIRGLIPRHFAELAETVPIGEQQWHWRSDQTALSLGCAHIFCIDVFIQGLIILNIGNFQIAEFYSGLRT